MPQEAGHAALQATPLSAAASWQVGVKGLKAQAIAACLQHSASWWLGAIFSTLIPVIYALSGGMRASIVTDVAHSVTVVAFLIGLLAVLGSSNPASFGTWNGYGESPP